MTDPQPRVFEGPRVLVVEDDFILALDLQFHLRDAGAEVVGPVHGGAEALALLKSDPLPDGAILDVNLDGEMVFPVADLLRGHDIPMVFITGCDRNILPAAHADAPCFEKPLNLVQCLDTLSGAIRESSASRRKPQICRAGSTAIRAAGRFVRQ